MIKNIHWLSRYIKKSRLSLLIASTVIEKLSTPIAWIGVGQKPRFHYPTRNMIRLFASLDFKTPSRAKKMLYIGINLIEKYGNDQRSARFLLCRSRFHPKNVHPVPPGIMFSPAFFSSLVCICVSSRHSIFAWRSRHWNQNVVETTLCTGSVNTKAKCKYCQVKPPKYSALRNQFQFGRVPLFGLTSRAQKELRITLLVLECSKSRYFKRKINSFELYSLRIESALLFIVFLILMPA